jgi:hypothetical protein
LSAEAGSLPEVTRVGDYIRALACALPSAVILVVDPDEVVIGAEGSRLFSAPYRSRETLIRRRLREILPPDSQDMLRTRFRCALRGKSQAFDFRPGDGSELWVQLTPTHLGDPSVNAVTAVVQNVSARSQFRVHMPPSTRRLGAVSPGSEGLPRLRRRPPNPSGRTRAHPALIVFEITETARMVNLERDRKFAAALREFGCQLALDDLATGYGTFTCVKQVPSEPVRIDRKLIRDLTSSEDARRTVAKIVAMAREFGKETIAEGVQDPATLARLRSLGVDDAHGGPKRDQVRPERGRTERIVACPPPITR